VTIQTKSRSNTADRALQILLLFDEDHSMLTARQIAES